MIVILSCTKISKKPIFVGDVNDTLAELKYLLPKKTQCMDCMEEILRIITIDYNVNTRSEIIVLTQETLPYRICDVSLPKYNTGYVYMLISVKYLNLTYTRKMTSIRTIRRQHNSGLGSISTEPLHFQPYAFLHTYVYLIQKLIFVFEQLLNKRR